MALSLDNHTAGNGNASENTRGDTMHLHGSNVRRKPLREPRANKI